VIWRGDVEPVHPHPSSQDAARVRRALPAWLALNAMLVLAIGHGFVAAAGATPTWDAALYAHVAFAAAGMVTVCLLGAAAAGVTLLPGGGRLVSWLAPAIAAGALGFLWVDRAAFATYRFHLGGLAWDTLGVPGALAELGVRPASPTGLLVVVAVVAVAEGLVLHGLAGHARLVGRGRGWRWLAATTLLLLVAERGLFWQADRAGRRDVVRMARLVPFHPALLGSDLATVAPALAGLAPPPASAPAPVPPVRFAPDAPHWNVLWIVLDSWRADAMTPSLTPAIAALGARSSVFRNHTSGGDATRYGLVSMLYGLPAATWSQLVLERQSPPLLAVLRQRGWRLGLFTSVDLPDIEAVMFADVPAATHVAAPPARASVKDRATLDALTRFLAAPPAGHPFFAFVHLISTHLPYDPSCRLPRVAHGDRPRYERAVTCADRLVARALRAVWLGDTIVVVTADHGEAFGEDGVFGHANGFTLPQLRVPLVLHVPGRPPAVIDYPTTHHDLAATLFDALGAPFPATAAGIGRSLFDGVPSTRLFACSRDECAIHDREGSVVFGLGVRRPGEIQIRDRDGESVAVTGDLGRRRLAQVLDLLALQRTAHP
jgi:membrane-anchored protein YejM (alkaline phosphatase superfamily)